MTLAANARHHRILVIDDQEGIHADFRKILAPREISGSFVRAKTALFGAEASAAPPQPIFEIESALQGQAGVRIVEAARAAGIPFQVAFVDMRMPPGWDGLTTIRELWRVDPALQIVVCTAYSDVPLESLTQDLGASDRLLILKKPFEAPEILQLAITLCVKWRAELEANARLDELERRVQQRTSDIEYVTMHDQLTGLANRTLLSNRLDACIERRARDPRCHYAVLFLDLDNFKQVNDCFGHEVGDELLIEIARCLSDRVRDTDLVSANDTMSRLGGDEFVILLEDLRETRDATLVAERLLATLATPRRVGDHELMVRTSIGIATSDTGYECAADAIRDADTAMYRAKAEGRARYVMFDKAMHETAKRRMELERALHDAIRERTLGQHYQPIVRIEDGALVGFEALVRWHDPLRGAIPAIELITLAEESGLIHELGILVLENVCRQLRDWQSRHPAAQGLKMSVNLSRQQILAPNVAARIATVLHQTGVAASSLIFEVTESSTFHDPATAARVLRELREYGAEIHLDDFGVGFSSLNDLSRLPLSAMKLDHAFLRDACAGSKGALAYAAVVQLARAYGLRLVAEGVETPEQLAMLRELGVDFAQGYLLGRPVAASEAEKSIGAMQAESPTRGR